MVQIIEAQSNNHMGLANKISTDDFSVEIILTKMLRNRTLQTHVQQCFFFGNVLFTFETQREKEHKFCSNKSKL